MANSKDRDRANQLAQRVTLERIIRGLPPGRTREILTDKRDRIPLDDPWHGGPRDAPRVPTKPSGPRILGDRWGPPPIPGGDPPTLSPCVGLSSRARHRLASGENRWWQNWGKTRAYIAERMFFPTNVYELCVAVSVAEADNRPLRAVGGGWSFSDVNMPGTLLTPRPAALGVEAYAELVPLTETFPTDPFAYVIASVAQPPAEGPPDAAGSLVMFNTGLNAPDLRWEYMGAGEWSVREDAKHDLMSQRSWGGVYDLFRIDDFTDAQYVYFAYEHGFRPMAAVGPDGPGTLGMASLATGAFSALWFYNGNGLWTLRPLSSERPGATQGLLKDFIGMAGVRRPRPSTPAFSMSLLHQTRPVYLINTHSLASSLQQKLPSILSEEALRRTRSTLHAEPETYYFHVEGGITMAALGELLSHQSPSLAIEATGGNPGATLAGSLATATHGGEHNAPLLQDRVKAVHFVGPGGLQWWIEGRESIADPEKLLAEYPCLSRERIIHAAEIVGGLSAQDWLDAVVVSLGCMGVVYSMVLEVVPMFGIHEAIVETTWTELLFRARVRGRPITQLDLRDDRLSDLDRRELGPAIMRLLEDGIANGTGIARDTNSYIDLAIDPNPYPAFSSPDDVRIDGLDQNWRCWVLNREKTWTVPFDHKPAPRDMIGRVGAKLGEAIGNPAIAHRLQDIFNVDFLRRFEDQDVPIDAMIRAFNQIPAASAEIERWLRRLFASADTIGAILDMFTTKLDRADDSIVTGAIVSAVFSGLLGIKGGRADATAAASKVGEIGFPASGIMGTAIEIAMSSEDAWPFLQTEVLDHITAPFFGYISVRICPATRAHVGMQQFTPSVMIEVVAFETRYARTFVTDLQRRTVERIRDGLDAILHWGLENERLDSGALRAIPSLNTGSPSKLEKFMAARAHLKAAAPTVPSVFDSATTRRLRL